MSNATGGKTWRRLNWWLAAAVAVAGCNCCGCAMKDATKANHIVNLRNSTVGLKVTPFGDGPGAPKVALGSVVSQYTTVPTAPDKDGVLKAAPVLNRTDVRAPGARVTDTVAHGEVGAQFNEHVVGAVKALHGAD